MQQIVTNYGMKSSVPVFTVLVQRLLYGVHFDNLVYKALVPIVGGVFLATWTEAEFDLIGFWAALLASVVSALTSILSGRILSRKLDTLNVMYYVSPISFALLAPVACFYELANIQQNWIPQSTQHDYLLLFTSGSIAFFLSTFFYLVCTEYLY
jgi:drug/metabolite transporter (DMT)-like permease